MRVLAAHLAHKHSKENANYKEGSLTCLRRFFPVLRSGSLYFCHLATWLALRSSSRPFGRSVSCCFKIFENHPLHPSLLHPHQDLLWWIVHGSRALRATSWENVLLSTVETSRRRSPPKYPLRLNEIHSHASFTPLCFFVTYQVSKH